MAPGFTLVEILIVVIILGLLAAIVIPAFSDSTKTTRENMLLEDLRMLRTQIETYRIQHNDVSPGYPDGDTTAVPTAAAFTAQMTTFSNAQGQTNAAKTAVFEYGPYLTSVPNNPVNNSNTVIILADNEAFPGAPAAANLGWIYKPGANILKAACQGTDSNGVSFYSY